WPRDGAFRKSPGPPQGQRGAHCGSASRPLRSRAFLMEAETRKPAASPRRRAPKVAKHAHGLTVLEDISAITARSEDLQETLERVVEVVAERVGTDVCSLYILDPRAQRLTLWATVGLDRNSIGKVTMSVEEGLTGMAIEKLEPVMAVDAITHPRYKFFPDTGEEKYHSFLGVPIIERGTPLGVRVVRAGRGDARRPCEGGEAALEARAQGIGGRARGLEGAALDAAPRVRRRYHRRAPLDARGPRLRAQARGRDPRRALGRGGPQARGRGVRRAVRAHVGRLSPRPRGRREGRRAPHPAQPPRRRRA